MDFLAALRYPFQDRQWLGKTLMAMLLVLIPVLGWFVLVGYGLRIIRRVANNNHQLPEWRYWGRDFNAGMMVFLGNLIYGLPLLPFICIALIVQTLGGSEAAFLLICCLIFPLLAYLVLFTPMFYSALAHYAITNDFTAFFNVMERIHDVSIYVGKTVTLMIGSMLLILLMAVPVIIAGFFVGLLFSSPLIGCFCLVVYLLPGAYLFGVLALVQFHVFGQWAKIIKVQNQPNISYDSRPY